ncbi:SH3 and cysteine-rich domain-containing protein-like [Rhipicephalus microplus]|uniref:SH3 and cysteine-rich domain-containing protein-like n=1 Tax=Rhipicephalus microplus TaxID=6941 RepID=UPI003F6D8001
MLQALPARAIRDHCDPSDSECLILREGDMVTVLEQCESGRWKGIVFGPGHSSRAGFFPATAVQLLHRQGESSHTSIRALISEEEEGCLGM